MKRIVSRILICSALCCSAGSLKALTLVDDHFLVLRTNQNLPTSSQWFASNSGGVPTLTNAAVGSMTGTTPGTASAEWITYFMPPGNPSVLKVGDTIKVTMTFSNNGVSAPAGTGFGLRMGLYNYSAGGTRVTSDGVTDSAVGLNVQGYGLFMRYGETNNSTDRLVAEKRTVTSNGALMGSSGAWTSINTNSGTLGDPGFSNNVVYTMVFSVTRTDADAVVITNSFTGPGLNLLMVGPDPLGGVYTNFDSFALRPNSAITFATNFVFLSFKVEGPPGALIGPSIVTDPVDMTLTVSDFGIFSVAAQGTGPLGYQWYFNNTATPLGNQTNQSLLLTNIQMSQAGQYFAIVTNNQGSATSAVATLTVTTPVHTPRGVIVDDTFQNSSRLVPVTPTTSDWASSVDGLLFQNSPLPSPLVATAQSGSSTLWVVNFVDPGATAPLDIDVGDALRVTMVFTPTNVAPLNTGSLRFGMFDFYDGSRILAQDGNLDTPPWTGSGGGTNARGYMVTCNFGTNFGDGTPLGFYVRNNLSSPALMNSTADFVSMGSGPSGMSNAPAFLSGSEYTLQMTAARVAPTSVQLTARITGPQLSNLGFLAYDNTYFTHRFSGFGLRSNRTTDSAEEFTISHFKVEVIAATNTPVPPFSITSFGKTNPTNFFLNWQSVAGKFYQVQSTTNLLAGTNSLVPWVTNTALAATGPTATWTNLNINGTNDFSPEHIFYRVVAPSQP